MAEQTQNLFGELGAQADSLFNQPSLLFRNLTQLQISKPPFEQTRRTLTLPSVEVAKAPSMSVIVDYFVRCLVFYVVSM